MNATIETTTPQPGSLQGLVQGTVCDPACGTGGFLAAALGIYFTPQHVLDFLEGRRTPDVNIILANPPFSK